MTTTVRDVIAELQRYDGNETITLSSKHEDSNRFDIKFINHGRDRICFKFDSDLSDEIDALKNSNGNLLEQVENCQEQLKAIINAITELPDHDLFDSKLMKISDMVSGAIEILDK